MTIIVFLTSLLGAMALGMPIAFALILCGVAMMIQQDLFDSQIIAQNVINGADSFPLMAVPFFMLAGEIMNTGGLSKRIVNLALTLVGHVRGGLGYVAILAACVLSALSGSAVADAAALSALLVPMMVKAGHDKARSGGLIAASGIIGPVIPPSIGFVIFGVAGGVSISNPASGLAILPAALCMVLVAPRSAKLVEKQGARLTMLTGYVFVLLGFVTMLLLWNENSPYWIVGLGYAFVGIGVGFAGTPASHSLTGSVPVTRVGMASGTADLQRDLGGAIMQSIFGALLAAGYAKAATAAIQADGYTQEINATIQTQLVKSFAGAESIAAQYPQYASGITAAARASFLEGDQWAYLAGIIAVLLGAVLVFVFFPKQAEEEAMLARFEREDAVVAPAPHEPGAAPLTESRSAPASG